MAIQIKAFANNDDAVIVWKPDNIIPECRGFALVRSAKTNQGRFWRSVPTWVGFEDEEWRPGTLKSSFEWPIQRFMWTDYLVKSGETVRYKVVPIIGKKPYHKPNWNLASPWTPWLKIMSGEEIGTSCYFNRGIVASQWISRRLSYVPKHERRKKLKAIIHDTKSGTRKSLSGDLRRQILKLLKDARDTNSKVYGFLYELNDPELILEIERLGKNMHLILANGSHKQGTLDQNRGARNLLTKNGRINLYHRMAKDNHLGHHKFLVICDKNDKPKRVWTGSTNWTVTGLCTQANNGLLIKNEKVATFFKQKWDLLKQAGYNYDKALKEANSKPMTIHVGGKTVHIWFAPLLDRKDLEHAKKLIREAEQGILFLLFKPGRVKTLLNEILSLRGKGLFIHGVVNEDPGGRKNPILDLYDRGQKRRAAPSVLIPFAVEEPLTYWTPEMRNYSLAMVHSKVVVIDPCGKRPVVMTGSHNLGPKASDKNDENLVIIENAAELAIEYAINILSIYNQYKWRYNLQNKKTAKRWKGLKDNDKWQFGLRNGNHWNEVLFWFGEYDKSMAIS